MNRIFLFIFWSIISVSLFPSEEGRFMHCPDIYNDKIVFSYEGDLWIASSSGGNSMRITNAPGEETDPKFSPDGKWIAFTASYDGNNNVYLIPSEGGIPKRITYVPGNAKVISWTPDGERIVFRSAFENYIGRDPKLYFVNKDGSAVESLPLDRGVLCSFSKDGAKMLYCRRGSEELTWKRYKGGSYQDIWLYDFNANSFTPISNYTGKNSYPIWIENNMYFVSDRKNGISNFYIQDLASKQIKQVTDYSDFDVMSPETDGSKIIFMQNGYINLLDLQTHKTTVLKIIIPSDRWALRDRNINPKDYIHSMDISNDGNSCIIEARGDVFVVPSGEGSTKNMSTAPGSRELYPKISPDQKWIAFFSDKSGEYQLYIQSIKGGEWIQLTTSLNKLIYHLSWSPDGNKILFGNKDFAIFVVDINSKKITKIDESHQLKNDEFYWEQSDYSWSPDSKWICYSFTQYNRNNQIFIYNLEENKKYPVTDDFFDNLNPCFDVNGKYLYYLSSRNYTVQMDFYEDNHILSEPYQVMVVQLNKIDKPLFAAAISEDNKKENKDFNIDVEGINLRQYPLPVSAGNYFYLKAGKGKVLWSSVPKFTESEYEEIFKPGSETKWDLHIYDVESQSEVIIPEKIRIFDLSSNGEHLIVNGKSDYYFNSVADAYKTKGLGSKLDLDNMNYVVDNIKEWNQIFDDAWRWYRDFFYDKNMHGRDWKAIGEKYKAYIPYLSCREDLNWTIQQMVGELCVSHTYIGGGDLGRAKSDNPIYTAWLGADLEPDNSGYYRFKKIYGPTEYNLDLKSPLCRPDMELKEGDYLIAINGKDIQVPDDYYKYLQVTEGQKIMVTLNSVPSKSGSKTYEIEPIKNTSRLRYLRWLTDNIKKVLKETDGKVGYMHINAMGSGGIGEFDKFWRAFRYKEGIIIDVRRNSGGWTEYFMIDKLERKMVAYNVLNGMEPFRYPGSVCNGKYVAISNENNGSDGEAFIEHFKARKLGTVIGVPSWGGLVGIINGQTTIDNGTIHQSNNAFYGKEGKWLVENHGADPDIFIDNDPASVMAGKDPQLDKAIETILKQIKEEPFTFPPVPPYPVK